MHTGLLNNMDLLASALPIIVLFTCAQSFPSHKRQLRTADSKPLLENTYHCDQDCRRIKRRRKMKETKTFMSAVRGGVLSREETEKKKRVILDRVMAGEKSFQNSICFWCPKTHLSHKL